MDSVDKLDRVVVLINDMTVKGNTRIQKYGFLMHKLYSKELHGLNFYADWRPYLYGPYSEELKNDLEDCISQHLVTKFTSPTNTGREFSNYNLTTKGRMRLRKISGDYDIIKELYQKFTQLNKKPITSVLKDIYLAYPEYTVKSEIKESVMNDQI
ncbi:MAG: hypothetical protein IS860_10505 [Nitrosopumilus sp.]|nr:hypothetical protein [Nitrosopumilus sp.]